MINTYDCSCEALEICTHERADLAFRNVNNLSKIAALEAERDALRDSYRELDHQFTMLLVERDALAERVQRCEAFVARADEYRAWAGDCLDTLFNDLYDAARAAIDAQEGEAMGDEGVPWEMAEELRSKLCRFPVNAVTVVESVVAKHGYRMVPADRGPRQGFGP